MSTDIDPEQVKKLKIDELLTKQRPAIEVLGEFKLKDKIGRNAVRIDFDKATRPLSEAVALYILKIAGETNKIRVTVEWKPEQPKEEKKP